MDETLIWVTLLAAIMGMVAGSVVGAYVARHRIIELTDLMFPDYRRMIRGAFLGGVAGGLVLPKLTLMGYLVYFLISNG